VSRNLEPGNLFLLAAGCMGIFFSTALFGVVISTVLIIVVETEIRWVKIAVPAVAALGFGILLASGRKKSHSFSGYEIVHRREAMGLSQADLARYLDIEQARLNQWENGQARIPRWLPSHLDMLEDLGPRT